MPIYKPMLGWFNATPELPQGEDELEVELMRRVFESVVNGVSISDARLEDMPLIYVNPAFERMTGYSRDEVMGRNCRFLQGGEAGEHELGELRLAVREHREVRVVLKNYTKEGIVFWNELYLSPVFDSRNRLTHYVGIQNDITSRVELKRQIEHMALHDGLTGLANRTLFMDRLRESLDRARRQHSMTAVFSSIWMASRRSTIFLAMTAGTNFSERLRRGSRGWCGRSTAWGEWVAMNS